MLIVVSLVYGILVFVSLTNVLLMRRPSGSAPICFEVMVPARNEADNLPFLIPPLIRAGVTVTVFDDDSLDGTSQIAAELGATVIRSEGELPVGWTGKTRACHELSKRALAPWVLFLDADVRPDEHFASTFSNALAGLPDSVSAVSGFPRMIPGRGLEPAYLAWVPWILLATNPFGLVALTGKGHNRFMNGQIGAWRLEELRSIQPFESVKGEVLEDVKIGRLLAKLSKRVEVWNLSNALAVHMYPDLDSAIKGMSKNSCEIAPGLVGNVLFAGLFSVFGWGWVTAGQFQLFALGGLIVSKLLVDRVIRYPLWTTPLIPFSCTGASITILYSAWLKSRGRIEWKGRSYV